ncbi:hypothetical protein ACH5RR_008703 [Cinchona calisaya]|uniref:Uncharacterized protein n=1 Tax=Cinchona calisaya TaxID=153742 RepID=A0ABD3AC37_9GENT
MEILRHIFSVARIDQNVFYSVVPNRLVEVVESLVMEQEQTFEVELRGVKSVTRRTGFSVGKSCLVLGM